MSQSLPLPFYDDPWRDEERNAAQALWAWHLGLWKEISSTKELRPGSFFAEEEQRAAAGQSLVVLSNEVSRDAYAAAAAHDLPLELLAVQIPAAAYFQESVAFEAAPDLNAFMEQWAIPHGRLLARLAGLTLQAQLVYADELSRGFFLTGRLANLKQDLERGWVFIPMDEVSYAGVSLDQLNAGDVNEAMRKLLWKQAVRARDAFAQGQPLARDLTGRYARSLKRWWFGALEVLNEIESRDYDVWSEPISVSGLHRFQVRLQSFFGKSFGS